MSRRHPILGITGSSGAGTSTARLTCAHICRDLGLNVAYVEGDAFHAYDRERSRELIRRARIRGEHFSLFGPAGNLLERLERLLRSYGDSGSGEYRRYLHTEREAAAERCAVGTFTPWSPLPNDTDLLIYEGLHGGYVHDDVNIARHMDLLIGVTPIINLEWLQKLHRDIAERGYGQEAVRQTILRRIPDYLTYIIPQFSRTDVNFQRVPLVDTANPFDLARLPQPDETLIVIHFNPHTRLDPDLPRYCKAIPNAFLSNPQTLVVPGQQSTLALDLILRPAIVRLIEQRNAAGLESGLTPS